MATLTVTINESVTLNGVDQGGSYSGFTNSNIPQVMRKIVRCTAGTEFTLYQAADATATTGTGAAWFDEDSIKYVRKLSKKLMKIKTFIYLECSSVKKNCSCGACNHCSDCESSD